MHGLTVHLVRAGCFRGRLGRESAHLSGSTYLRGTAHCGMPKGITTWSVVVAVDLRSVSHTCPNFSDLLRRNKVEATS
jgi:hypothetical protein